MLDKVCQLAAAFVPLEEVTQKVKAGASFVVTGNVSGKRWECQFD